MALFCANYEPHPRISDKPQKKMGTVVSSPNNQFSNERYITPESKYDLRNHDRSTFPMRVNIYSSAGLLLQDVAFQDIDVYFAKRTKMALAVSEFGKPRLIPFNSAIKCSIVDDFSDSFEECLEGRTFSSVEELMKANPLPRAVRAEHGYFNKDNAHTVESEDVLVIKGMKEENGECILECNEAISNH